MTPPSPPDDRLVFSETVESLFVRGLAGQLSPRALDRLKAAGLDVSRPLLPAYPEQVFGSAAAIAAEECYPELPIRDAYYQLGLRTVLGMEQTLVGRAAWSMARIIGPLRTFERMPKSMRRGATYTDGVVERLGPSSVKLTCKGFTFPYPEFMLGSIQGSLTMLRLPAAKTELVSFDSGKQEVVLLASW